MDIKLHETELFKHSPSFWSMTTLVLASIGYLLSDWTILYSSFGDFILAFTVVLMLSLGKISFSKNQFIVVISIIVIILSSSILSFFNNTYWFNYTRAILSSIKLIFHSSALIILYNFIKNGKLEKQFLNILNVTAIFAVVIGVFITLLLYSGNEEIPLLLWTYTRQDSRSYFFGVNEYIIRTRSLFSEPAHLGYYLNTVFFANVFYKKKSNVAILSIIAVGIILTLSYSMYFVFISVCLTLLIINILNQKFYWSRWYWLLLLPVSVLIYFLWDFITVTIFQRTLNIFSGEDGSANIRIIGAWDYVTRERLIYGNGIGHTPPITNIYAYVLSDFGLIGFIPYFTGSLLLLYKHVAVLVFFVTMNSAKGGYLNPLYWFVLLIVITYGIDLNEKKSY